MRTEYVLITKSLTVADMAEQVALSERQFRRVFRDRFAMAQLQHLQ
uniref:HTH araC/xylS-type domain-containing protein n=1 Tax=Rheinheimera sp. BAL341 TaxID=1708203 RepID=A0A486XUX5_9GAMM